MGDDGGDSTAGSDDSFADMMSGLLRDINQGLAAMQHAEGGGLQQRSEGGGRQQQTAVPQAAARWGEEEALQREPSFGDGI